MNDPTEVQEWWADKPMTYGETHGEAVWGDVIRDSEKLLAAARFGPRRLPTDWIDVTTNAAIAPAARTDNGASITHGDSCAGAVPSAGAEP